LEIRYNLDSLISLIQLPKFQEIIYLGKCLTDSDINCLIDGIPSGPDDVPAELIAEYNYLLLQIDQPEIAAKWLASINSGWFDADMELPDPINYEGGLLLGSTLYQTGIPERGLMAIVRTLELYPPDSLDIFYGRDMGDLALVYGIMGDETNAAKCISLAIENGWKDWHELKYHSEYFESGKMAEVISLITSTRPEIERQRDEAKRLSF